MPSMQRVWDSDLQYRVNLEWWCKPVTLAQRQEDWKFTILLSYISSLDQSGLCKTPSQ